MTRWRDNWDNFLVASVATIGVVCAQADRVVGADDAEPNGRIVQISPDDEIDLAIEDEDVVTEPQFWIGIQGQSVQSDVLRTHLQLAEDMGVVVEDVVPESPAAKAGLRRHDIILRANGDGVDNMRVLQRQVLAGKDQPIELKIIRLGKDETIVVVPEPRPERLDDTVRRRDLQFRQRDGGRGDAMLKLFEQLQGADGLQGGLRAFGPGIVLEGTRLDFNQLPNGVSVSIKRSNDGPAEITVQRGDDVWTILGDDPKSLEQLPEELRPFVARMVRGADAGPMGGMQFDFGQELENLIPRGLGGFKNQFGPDQAKQEQDLRERLERLETRLREMQERLEVEPRQGE